MPLSNWSLPGFARNDAERSQSPQEAVRRERHVVAAYAGLGYELVRLPRAPIAERIGFTNRRALASAG